MKSRLSDVPAAIRLSRAALRNIHENLFWAFFYNVIGIPLAAGIWIPIFGWKLNPMFGAAAMSLSSFCVVSNALRLNFFDIRRSDRDKKIKTKIHNNKEADVKINYDNIKHADIENIAQNYWNSDGIYNIAAAEDGYYYVTNEDFLVYFDINTGDTVPVCAKPDCMHDLSLIHI
mgnify:CR=1 FL=1